MSHDELVLGGDGELRSLAEGVPLLPMDGGKQGPFVEEDVPYTWLDSSF